MAPHVIVSYDDTLADHDGLMLARLFQDVGARLTLAFVRHATHGDRAEEQRAERTARERLERGAALLEDPHAEQHVVLDPSTARGLARLAEARGADVVAFGSEYRTARGRVCPGRAAQALLERGGVAVALAPAGYAETAGARDLDVVGVLPGTADEASIETAFSLAARHDARVTDRPHEADLLVVGSRPQAREAEVMISAAAALAIEQASVPVLVVARGVPLNFGTLVTI